MQQEYTPNTPSIKCEVLTGLLRYTQECLPVKDFPPLGDPAWDRLWYHITHDSRLVRPLSGDASIESVLHGATVVDPNTRRVCLDLEGPHGRELEEDFPEDLHDLFKIAWETRGFLQFN